MNKHKNDELNEYRILVIEIIKFFTFMRRDNIQDLKLLKTLYVMVSYLDDIKFKDDLINDREKKENLIKSKALNAPFEFLIKECGFDYDVALHFIERLCE